MVGELVAGQRRGRSSDHGAVSVASTPSHSDTVRDGESARQLTDGVQRQPTVAELANQRQPVQVLSVYTASRPALPGRGRSSSAW